MNKLQIIGICLILLLIPSAYAIFLKDIGEVQEKVGADYADDLVEMHKIDGIQNLAHNVKSGKSGFKFEVKGTKRLLDESENIVAVSKNVPNPAKKGEILTEIDAIGNRKLFEIKDKSWGTKDPTKTDGMDFVRDMQRKYSGYGSYMQQNNLNDFNRILVFEDYVSESLKTALENIGWTVRTI